jgi:hypothetical protein
MAKETNNGRIVLAYIEGDQTTLQQALHQFGAVVSRGMNPPSRTVVAIPINQQNTGNGDTSTNTNGSAKEYYEIVDNPETTKTPEEATVVTAAKGRKPKRVSKVPDLLPDEDLMSDEISFRDYANKLNPSSQFHKYLVIAAWFKRYKSTNEITIRHVYSCYQLMKWQSPDELSTPFRDMRRLHNYFSRGKDAKHWVLTLVGSNEVDDLNQSSAVE